MKSLEEVKMKKASEPIEFEKLNKLLSKAERIQRLTFYFSRFIGGISRVKWPSSLIELDLSGFNK